LGKFPYFIYYRIKTDYISIVGIWHTSRLSEPEFSEFTGFAELFFPSTIGVHYEN